MVQVQNDSKASGSSNRVRNRRTGLSLEELLQGAGLVSDSTHAENSRYNRRRTDFNTGPWATPVDTSMRAEGITPPTTRRSASGANGSSNMPALRYAPELVNGWIQTPHTTRAASKPQRSQATAMSQANTPWDFVEHRTGAAVTGRRQQQATGAAKRKAKRKGKTLATKRRQLNSLHRPKAEQSSCGRPPKAVLHQLTRDGGDFSCPLVVFTEADPSLFEFDGSETDDDKEETAALRRLPARAAKRERGRPLRVVDESCTALPLVNGKRRSTTSFSKGSKDAQCAPPQYLEKLKTSKLARETSLEKNKSTREKKAGRGAHIADASLEGLISVPDMHQADELASFGTEEHSSQVKVEQVEEDAQSTGVQAHNPNHQATVKLEEAQHLEYETRHVGAEQDTEMSEGPGSHIHLVDVANVGESTGKLEGEQHEEYVAELDGGSMGETEERACTEEGTSASVAVQADVIGKAVSEKVAPEVTADLMPATDEVAVVEAEKDLATQGVAEVMGDDSSEGVKDVKKLTRVADKQHTAASHHFVSHQASSGAGGTEEMRNGKVANSKLEETKREEEGRREEGQQEKREECDEEEEEEEKEEAHATEKNTGIDKKQKREEEGKREEGQQEEECEEEEEEKEEAHAAEKNMGIDKKRENQQEVEGEDEQEQKQEQEEGRRDTERKERPREQVTKKDVIVAAAAHVDNGVGEVLKEIISTIGASNALANASSSRRSLLSVKSSNTQCREQGCSVPVVSQPHDQPERQRSPSLSSAHKCVDPSTSMEVDAIGPESFGKDDPSKAMGRLQNSESHAESPQARMFTSSLIRIGMMRGGMLDRVDESSDNLRSRGVSAETLTETVQSLDPPFGSTVIAEESGHFDRCVRKRKRKKSREDPEPLRPPIPFGSVVQLSGLPETTGCNGRTALFKSWEPEFARAFVQLLPPGMSAGEMRVVRTCHLELVR
eukprot:CAMPEP_0172670470 /NCGR_PEP_ID=MMETSP1074-20121228/10317_1 /TAXON_ID=2916 /ORGANISM="Ceratium fusus, Strain PA161109" /LENGTH=951 /DNA_ID=CAMNT_0013487391 /DNA_START=163 /DNA_END=3018 /DNA_ORIENTATION=-